ncbi:MAG: nitroreductase [Arenimonas sp.]
MNLIKMLDQRRSTPSRTLHGPGPNSEEVQQMLTSALRVPDHGKLAPWRFLKIQGDSRLALGELLAKRAIELDANAPDSVIEKDRARFSFAPLIITVIARLTPNHKVPVQEQILSGGAVCFALLQAAQGLGYGAQWLTGWAAYDSKIMKTLGIEENESILGFIHIGNADEVAPERVRPKLQDRLSDLRL